MVVSRHRRLVRWAYFLESSIPYRTSLCAFFWRTVLLTPLKVCLIIGGAGLVLTAVYILSSLAFEHAAIIGKVLMVALPVLGIGIWLFKPRGYMDAPAKRAANAIAESVVVQGALAVKSKICPLIELN